MAKTIKLDDLLPYLAPVLLEATGDLEDERLVREVIRAVSEHAGRSTARKRRIVATTTLEEDDGLYFQALVYREAGAPPWLAAIELEDVVHHLVVVAAKGKSLAICASDSAMRERIVKDLKVARRMPRAAIAAFVGPEAKAIWLNGIHTPTSSKADTKALTGPTLEYAIDPIGDQTYYYSAARTIPDVPGLKTAEKKRPVVGAAPGGARIWVRRSSNWRSFKAELAAVIAHATQGKRAVDPFASLSQAIDSAAGVEHAYAISVIPAELLSEEEISDADREAARRWAFDATYVVKPTDGLSLTVEPSLGGQRLGLIELSLTLAGGDVTIDHAWIDEEPGQDAARDECTGFLTDIDKVKIYYESGHAIAQGHCYAGGYTDQPFGWSFQTFAGYAVDTEKPTFSKAEPLPTRIAVDGDNSLFAYVCEKMFLGPDGNPKGWLASDDGSMELADFIHIEPEAQVISLVHIKGSGSKAANREAAPADYEIVVSQAVKNIRHLDRRLLLHELTRGKAKKIGAAVWHDGVKQPNREGFLKAVEKLPASASKVLIVLQPRLTKSEIARCRAAAATPTRSMRIKQIDTLMLAARASALACGATFIGIADEI
ncbi:hypothetical protein NKH48_20100 [Mesorhizobium sp. M1233]|uniref:hypothetical protein n=1 Tax=Mesorhizobium sp. M1233 TaxID=2957072 RepID=UPI0033353128